MPSGRPTRTLRASTRRAASTRPVSWLPPPVSTIRRPTSAAKPEALSRSRTSSRISSTRGLMIRLSAERGTWLAGSSVVADRRHGEDLALVGGMRQRAAMHRLQPLGILDPRREPAGDVVGDVLAADGDGVGMDELALHEDGHGGRAAAEIDAGAAELGFVVDERRQAAGIGRGDERVSSERWQRLMAELEVAERLGIDARPCACRRRAAARPCRADRRCRRRHRANSRSAARG